MQELYGEDVRLVPYRQRRPFFSKFAASLAGDALHGLEERASWSRFGL
jgi:serine protease SohB